MKRVVVVPHDPRWSIEFAVESRRVEEALGSNIVTIHHVGSTAIPTIHAKPIIDMLPVARDLDAVDRASEAMTDLGYEPLGEFGIIGRRYFRKHDDGGARTHHVHVFASGHPEVERHLRFRDFLIEHPSFARRYSDLKRTLAEEHPADIESYMDGKDALIKEIDRYAAAWRAATTG